MGKNRYEIGLVDTSIIHVEADEIGVGPGNIVFFDAIDEKTKDLVTVIPADKFTYILKVGENDVTDSVEAAN